MESYPLVSVLMTAYNREQYIAEAIESVLASSYTNFELIVVDDGSVDDTIAIVKKYLAIDQRIQLYINEKNLGDYPNRNKAASFAKGKYLMYCDSDDLFLENSISYCTNAMELYPQCGIGMYSAQNKPEAFVMPAKDNVQHHFFKNPILNIGPGGTIILRSFFLVIDGYPVVYGPANDMYFNLIVCCKTPILFLPKPFLYYRIHPGQEKNNEYSYIHYNYRYLSDALLFLDLGLNKKDILYLNNKNKRRFVVNLYRSYLKTKSILLTIQLWKNADFRFRDLIRGIFHI